MDVLIVGSVNTSDSLSFDVALQCFKKITGILTHLNYDFTFIVQTLARGGHVLIPTLPSGLIYHLLEAVDAAKNTFDGKIIDAFDKPLDGGEGEKLQTESTPVKSTSHVGGTSLIGKVGECPSYFIAASAKASLVYVNAFVEWLVAEKQVKTSDPHLPFTFDEVFFLKHQRFTQSPVSINLREFLSGGKKYPFILHGF